MIGQISDEASGHVDAYCSSAPAEATRRSVIRIKRLHVGGNKGTLQFGFEAKGTKYRDRKPCCNDHVRGPETRELSGKWLERKTAARCKKPQLVSHFSRLTYM